MSSTLPPGYLRKTNGQWRQVRLLDIVTLLHNVHLGAGIDAVGFVDAAETLQSLTAKLDKKVLVDPNLIESALWSCNILDETSRFWDVKDRSFDEFVKDLLHGEKFDRSYNLIKVKE